MKELTQSVVGKNHVIYMDNFFTSVPFFLHLLEENTMLVSHIGVTGNSYLKS